MGQVEGGALSLPLQSPPADPRVCVHSEHPPHHLYDRLPFYGSRKAVQYSIARRRQSSAHAVHLTPPTTEPYSARLRPEPTSVPAPASATVERSVPVAAGATPTPTPEVTPTPAAAPALVVVPTPTASGDPHADPGGRDRNTRAGRAGLHPVAVAAACLAGVPPGAAVAAATPGTIGSQFPAALLIAGEHFGLP